MSMGKTEKPSLQSNQTGLCKMSMPWETNRGGGTADQRRPMRIVTCVQDLTRCCSLDLICFLAVHVLNAWSLLEACGTFRCSDLVLGILSVKGLCPTWGLWDTRLTFIVFLLLGLDEVKVKGLCVPAFSRPTAIVRRTESCNNN